MKGKALPPDWWRWHLVRATGWTLAQVDGLSLAEWARYLQIVDGENKAASGPGGKSPRPSGRRKGRR